MKAEYRENEKNYFEYYNEVEICSASADVHPKSAIQVRNQKMVDQSDLVVYWVQRKYGGAYKTMLYAEKQQKKIINLADDACILR